MRQVYERLQQRDRQELALHVLLHGANQTAAQSLAGGFRPRRAVSDRASGFTNISSTISTVSSAHAHFRAAPRQPHRPYA